MRRIIKSVSVLLLASALFVSCSKEKESAIPSGKVETSHLMASQEDDLGAIHNEVMKYAEDYNFDFSSQSEFENSLVAMQTEFLKNNYSGYYDESYIDDFKGFYNPDVVAAKLNDIDAILADLVSNGFILNHEMGLAIQLKEACLDNYNGLISNQEFGVVLEEIKSEVQSGEQFIPIMLQIGSASVDYWENYPADPNAPAGLPIAPFVARDAAGALVSGTITAAIEYSSTGNVSLSSVGKAALIGAASASIGLVNKVAKGIINFFS